MCLFFVCVMGGPNVVGSSLRACHGCVQQQNPKRGGKERNELRNGKKGFAYCSSVDGLTNIYFGEYI